MKVWSACFDKGKLLFFLPYQAPTLESRLLPFVSLL